MNGYQAPAVFFGVKRPSRLSRVRVSCAACSVDVQSGRPMLVICTGFRWYRYAETSVQVPPSSSSALTPRGLAGKTGGPAGVPASPVADGVTVTPVVRVTAIRGVPAAEWPIVTPVEGLPDNTTVGGLYSVLNHRQAT